MWTVPKKRDTLRGLNVLLSCSLGVFFIGLALFIYIFVQTGSVFGHKVLPLYVPGDCDD